MESETATLASYDVAVDYGSLAAWDLGEEGTGYAVQLTGPMDERWVRSYYLLRIDSPGYSRFHLDTTSGIVWFACRRGDRPAKIVPVLEILAALVASTNRRAASSVS